MGLAVYTRHRMEGEELAERVWPRGQPRRANQRQLSWQGTLACSTLYIGITPFATRSRDILRRARNRHKRDRQNCITQFYKHWQNIAFALSCSRHGWVLWRYSALILLQFVGPGSCTSASLRSSLVRNTSYLEASCESGAVALDKSS
jgi:hypothetical protein